MLTDDDLDTRLRAAGERFRAGTSESARVTPPRHTRRRRMPLLTAAASAAVVVGLVVAITQLTGRPAPHGSAAPGHATPITGIQWHLTAAVDAKGNAVPVTGQVELFIDNATLTANDGCNAIGGPVQLRGNELRFGNLVSTAMGCPDAGEQVRVVDAVLRDTVSYAIEGGTLTLIKPGTGSLTYTVAKPAPTTPPDPSALAARRWLLDTIERSANGTNSAENVSTGYVLVFDAKGGFRLTETCGEMVGTFAAHGDMLLFSQQHFVNRQCSAADREQAMTVQSAFSRATWTLDDNGTRLTLSTGDIRLVFGG